MIGTDCAGDCDSYDAHSCTNARRIRELEAEVADLYQAEVADLYQRMWAQNDRADKAEAEVERLRAIIWNAGIDEMFKGGGRDSGLREADVPVKGSSSPDPAANPAARKEARP